jgi:anti-sigma-K factor RskA
MRYDNPQLREWLAGEYVLGTLPARARRRFERLMAADAELARMVGEWAERLRPLDAATPAEEPPARVWRAIEARIAGGAGAGEAGAVSSAPHPPWYNALALWRGLAIAAGAAAVALLLYIAAAPSRAPAPAVVAVLAGRGAVPGWVAVSGPRPGDVSIAAVAPASEPKPHAFELWSIVAGPPRSLGLLPLQTGESLVLHSTQLPPPGGVLAVSLEPPGGSATGLPTGPVLYQGKILLLPR